MTKPKDIPTPNAPNFAARVREELMKGLGSLGNRLDQFATLRLLQEGGIIAVRPGGKPGSPPVVGPGTGVGESPPDLTPPPNATGLALTASLSHFFVECDPQTYTVGHGHGQTILYGLPVAPGDPLPTFGDAIELARFPGVVYAYPSLPATTWRVWIKWQSRDGGVSVSPTGGINGMPITTGVDVEKMVTAMTGPGQPFKIVTSPITLPDGSIVPVGTYTSDAYIHNGEITNAKIANLAVDNAKIASLAVDKLTAGSLNIGAFIQSSNYVAGVSGFRINGAGFAEFSGATFRGAVFASSGTFAGSLSAATGTFNGDISAASGNFRDRISGGSINSYAWPPGGSGQRGYFLGTQGMLIGNANDGQYFQVTGNGDVVAPQFSIVSGVATFTGSINVVGAAGTRRLEITNSELRVYDNAGTLRVRLGIW